MSSFWLLIRRLLFRERHQRIQQSLERSYSLHWTASVDEEECEFEEGAEYCDDQLEEESLPDHLVPSFARGEELKDRHGAKFPRNFVLDWEAGGFSLFVCTSLLFSQIFSDGCLSQDLSVSDVEGEEEQKQIKVEKASKEEEHSIVTCTECREFSLTAF